MKAVRLALDILRVLSREYRPLGVNEISRITGVNPTTTHRLLASLRSADLVHQDPVTRRYFLGRELVALGSAVQRQTHIFQKAVPAMRALRDELGETVAFGVRRRTRRIFVGQLQGFGSLQFSAPIGEQLPLYVGAAGTSFVAYLPPEELELVKQEALAAGMDWDHVMEGATRVRKDGYLWSFGEVTPGAFSCAAPVLGPEGGVSAILAVNGPLHRHTPDREGRIGARLREVVAGLSVLIRG